MHGFHVDCNSRLAAACRYSFDTRAGDIGSLSPCRTSHFRRTGPHLADCRVRSATLGPRPGTGVHSGCAMPSELASVFAQDTLRILSESTATSLLGPSREAGDCRAPRPPSGPVRAWTRCGDRRVRSGVSASGPRGPGLFGPAWATVRGLYLRLLFLGGARAVSAPPYCLLTPRQASVPRLSSGRPMTPIFRTRNQRRPFTRQIL